MAYALPDLVANLRLNTSQLNNALDSTERRLKAFNGISSISTDIDGIPVAVIGVLAQQFAALTAAVAPAVGAIAAVPAAVSVAGAGISTLAVGLSGLSAAFKKSGGGAKAASVDTTSLKRSVEAASRGIVQAQRAVVQAMREVEEANQGVADAVRDVSEAQKRAQRIQEDLNAARAAATKTLQSYQNQLANAALDEEAADLARIQAQKALAKEIKNGQKDQIKLRQLRLDVAEAELRYKEAAEGNLALQKEAVAAQQAGIEGDQRVVEAKERAADATYDVELANRSLVQAQLAVADANQGVIDSQEKVTLAQQALTDAMAALASAGVASAAGVDKQAEALAKLSPSARAFVKSVLGLETAWLRLRNAVQEALFVGLDKEVKALANRSLPTLQAGMVGVASSLNLVAKEASKAIQTPIFQKALIEVFNATRDSVAELASAVEPLIRGLARLTVAVLPAIRQLNKLTVASLKTFAAFLNSEEGIERVKSAIANGFAVIGKLIEISKNLSVALFNIFSAAEIPDFLDNLVKVTDQFARFTASAEGQEDLRLIFGTLAQISENLAQVIPVVAQAILALFKGINSLPEPVRDTVLQFAALSFLIGPLIAKFASLSIGIKGLLGLGSGITGLVARLFGFDKQTRAAAAATRALSDESLGLAKRITSLKDTAARLGQEKYVAEFLNDNKTKARKLGDELQNVQKELSNLEQKKVGLDVDFKDLDNGNKSAAKVGTSFAKTFLSVASGVVVGGLIEFFAGGLLTAIGTGLASAAAAIAAALFSVPALIAAAAAAAALLIYHFRTPIADFFTKTLPAFFSETLPSLFSSVGEIFGRLPEIIAGAMGFVLGTLYVKGKDLITGLKNGIVDTFIQVKDFFVSLGLTVFNLTGDLLGVLYAKGQDLISGTYEGILFAWKDPKAFFLGLGLSVLSLVGNLLRTLYAKGKDLISGFYNGILDIWHLVEGFFGDIKDSVFKKVTALNPLEWLKQVGIDVIKGFLNGLDEKFDAVLTKAGHIGKSFISGFKDAVESKSPSKKMHAEGINIMLGLINGIEARRSALQNVIGNISSDILGGVSPAISGLGLGTAAISGNGSTTPTSISANPGTVINNNWTVEQALVPYTPEQVANETVDALRRLEMVY